MLTNYWRNERVGTCKGNVGRNKMFFVTDEADARSEKYVNILVGTLEDSSKIYLIACKLLSGSPSSSVICTIMDGSIT